MPTMRSVVARCTAATAVALLSLGTCTTALADPGNGKGSGPPDEVGKEEKAATKDEKSPSANANDNATENGPSANANANATKKQAATATSSAAAAPSGQTNGGGGDNGARAASASSSASAPAGAAADPAAAQTDTALVAVPAATESATTAASSSSAGGQGGGGQGVATGKSADPSDATLGQSLGPGNRGTGKIHRDETSPLDRRNQPKVGCFDVTGFHFDPNQQLSISIVGHGGPNAGRGSLSKNTSSDGSGNLLLNSQSLPAGMYKLTISTNRPGGVKHKVFKVTGDCPSRITPPGVTPPGIVEPPGGAPPRVVRIEGPVRERPLRPDRPERPERPERPVIPERPVTPLAPPAVPGVAQPGVPTLAFTGSSTPELVALGGSLVLLGAFALLATRRRSPAT